MTWALHVANLLILSSFVMRNILVLRMLSITAGIFFATYFLTLKTPNPTPVYWNALFACVNIVQIVRLMRANRKVPLSTEEVFLKDQIFHSLRALEIKQLFEISEVNSIGSADTITIPNDTFAIVLKGVLKSEDTDIQYRSGDLIGIHGYLGQPKDVVPLTSRFATTVLQWKVIDLQQWCEEAGDRKTMLLSALSKNLIQQSTMQR